MMPPQIEGSRAGTIDTAWALERAHCLLFSYNLQARFLFFGEQLPAESIEIPNSCPIHGPDVRAFFEKIVIHENPLKNKTEIKQESVYNRLKFSNGDEFGIQRSKPPAPLLRDVDDECMAMTKTPPPIR